MDILAAMLAYLGCVAGIVAALVMSCAIVLSTPDRPALEKQTLAMVAKPSAAKTATMKAKPSVKIPATAARVPPSDPVGTIVAQTTNTENDRQRSRITRVHLYRLVREERAKRWAYQQDKDFESLFMSYAD
jgi:hypothetical protein